jgi:hypothetical protein
MSSKEVPALNSMLQTTESPGDVQALAARLPGKVVLFGEHTYQRLRRIKGQVDPDNLIRANHPISAAD